jgi:hypothetical protein
LAQHERIFARDFKTYSVRPELGRRVNGVFPTACQGLAPNFTTNADIPNFEP